MSNSLKFYGYIVIILGIWFLGFLPRVFSLEAHWSSDETRWLVRSRDFILSTLDGDFSETLQAYHPGVTTMWLGGFSLWTSHKQNLSAQSSPSSFPLLSPSNLATARLTIAITTSCVILLAFFALRKLFGTTTAVIAGVFLAIDPIYLAQSRRLHTDALAASFLLLTILTSLIFLKDSKQLRYLFSSGICFGLACLSKSNALVCALWLCFVLALSIRQGDLAVEIGRAIHAFLVWIGTACLIFVCLWPVLWSYSVPIGGFLIPVVCIVVPHLIGLISWSSLKLKDSADSRQFVKPWHAVTLPLLVGSTCLAITIGAICKAVQPFVAGVGWALTTEHSVAHFFLGKVRYDPGWLFYPLILFIRSAPLTLPLFLFGCIRLWKLRDDTQYAKTYSLCVYLFMFVLWFTFCMSVGSKKFGRYLLPVFPIMDVLAAIGLVSLGGKYMQFKDIKSLPVIRISKDRAIGVLVIGLVTLIQVIPVLAVQPYYGTYYHPFWRITDITKVCTIGDASGLDIAADYLNQKPDAENLTVRVSPLAAEFFGYYFTGTFYGRDRDPGVFLPDYEVVYIRDVQINLVNLDDIDGTLEYVIQLNDIDHVWIYKLSP